ncbi:MAG: NAD(+) salvage pathway protein [Candelina submexicana]|nr:MAG: NAD(+) salvage pathway protein [Candelina submexicana]
MASAEKYTDFRPALLIVDFQEDFCPPHGALAVDDGRSIASTVNSLLQLPFVLKVATKDFHPPDHISFASNHPAPDNKPFESFTTICNPHNPSETARTRLWPVHCVQGTQGAELIPELDISRVDHVVEKGQDKRVEMYSAFTDPFRNPSVVRSELASILKDAEVSHVYIVGLAMDYCVRYTAIDSLKEGFVTYVVKEATKAVDPGYCGWGDTEKEFAKVGVSLISAPGPEIDKDLSTET